MEPITSDFFVLMCRPTRTKLRQRDGEDGRLSATRVGFDLQGDCYTLAKRRLFCELSKPFQKQALAISGFDVAPRPGSYSPLKEWFVSRRLLSKPGDRRRVEVLTGKAEDGLACFPDWPTSCDHYLLVDGRMLAATSRRRGSTAYRCSSWAAAADRGTSSNTRAERIIKELRPRVTR